jgi:hypothetical protein
MLTREQVASVYREVLGRTASEDEIAQQVAACHDLDALLRVALESEEYAVRLRNQGARSARDPTRVNFFHPDLARWGPSEGTRSEDGIAIVGRDGWLFLCGGTNANLGQYVGAVPMGPGWLEGWRDVVARRAEEIRALGVSSALLVVPDKLAVYEELYPEDLDRVGPRPIERLLAVPDLPIVYPLDDLLAARDSGVELFPRTDTHLTFRGNELLFLSVAGALGIDRPPDHSELPLEEYVMAGDLGVKFDPRIVSVVREPGSLAAAEIVEDNREEIAAVGAHIGTRRVFRNEQAPDPRVAVLFGDSYGFAEPGYQGLSWFMAQSFRETHFVWVPFGWDPDYVRRVGAGAVLVQGAERFVARVPHVSVDVSQLAEDTLRRERALGVEKVSS